MSALGFCVYAFTTIYIQTVLHFLINMTLSLVRHEFWVYNLRIIRKVVEKVRVARPDT